ncbi:hypothetical protein Rhe02_61130 [Rhizocola hellebori]|uniref:ABC3 transporter permease C-terminal domain-containing protein n=1 Tax=Rhizocola hellebori TaxID=1392758 RepID=A0A8J3QEX7_9ACTN|nr:hypothetical protein Rhe02_61130 [Rhizocola hellebori]
MLAMLRARLGIAATTFVLTIFAVAVALAGPLYARAAADSALAVEVHAAPTVERVITGDLLTGVRGPAAVDVVSGKIKQPYIRGFETVTSVLSNGVLNPDVGETFWLGSRTGVCEHLTLIRGRCANADREIVIREDTSKEHGFDVGSDVEFMASSFGGGRGEESIRLTVVGVYQTYLPTDVYWADRFMLAGSEGGPFFTNDRTVRSADGPQLLTTDLIATEEAFRDRSTLDADIKAAMDILSATQFQPHTEVESLIDHIEDAEETLLSSLIVATLPLIAICWYVMFLAIVGAVQHRRGELAVTALRGVPGRLRWWLPNAETMVPVLAGAIPGFLFGYAVTAALAAWLLPGAPLVTPTLPAVALAVLSVVGALLTAVIAQWRVTREPVSNLLRQVVRRGDSNAARAVEAVAGVLALVAGFQAATAAGAGGLALLVPLCFGLGIGMLAGRLVAAPAERLGRRLIRGGRLALGLATISVSRRPGSRAMVALLTVAFGLFGFALTVTDTAARAWEERAHVETGAYRVLSIVPVPAARLMDAVKAVDPQGNFAMAAATVQLPDAPPVVAVDSTRLARVANWPAGPGQPTAAQAAATMRPQEPVTKLVRGNSLFIPLTLNNIGDNSTARLELDMIKPNGERLNPITSAIQPGTAIYEVTTPDCAQKACRFTGMAVSLAAFGRQQVSVTVGEIRNESGEVVVDRGQLTDLTGWVQRKDTAGKPTGDLSAAGNGLTIEANSPIAVDLRIWVRSVPEPMPLLSTGDVPEGFAAVGSTVSVQRALATPMLPRLGDNGIMLDLRYAELSIMPRAEAQRSEVWLSADAPEDILQRIGSAGLTIQEDIRESDRLELFSRQAPALALGFLRLAALAAILLTAAGLIVAAILDRSRRAEDLSALLPHGLSRRTARGSAVLGRAFLVLISVVAGAIATAAAWLVAREVVPVYTTAVAAIPLPTWPDPTVGNGYLAAFVFLLGTCWVAARVARREGEGTVQ